MNRPRITLARTMAIVFAAAIVMFVVRLGPGYWASAAFSFAIAVLLFGILRALATSGMSRRRWAAFSLTGLTYIVLAFGPWFSSQVAPNLITTRLLDDSYRRYGGMMAPNGYGEPLAVTLTNGDVSTHVSHDYFDRMRGLEAYDDFQRAGHSLISVLLALAGVYASQARSPDTG